MQKLVNQARPGHYLVSFAAPYDNEGPCKKSKALGLRFLRKRLTDIQYYNDDDDDDDDVI